MGSRIANRDAVATTHDCRKRKRAWAPIAGRHYLPEDTIMQPLGGALLLARRRGTD